MTGQQIAKKWIETEGSQPFTYLQFQERITDFAKKYTTKFYRADSWDRFFRWAKNETPELKEVDGKYKTWQLKKDDLFSEVAN